MNEIFNLKNINIPMVLVFVLGLILVAPVRMNAQPVEITPFGGYASAGKVSASPGYLWMAGGHFLLSLTNGPIR